MSTAAAYPNLPGNVRNLVDKCKITSDGLAEKDQVAINTWLTRLQSEKSVADDLGSIDKELTTRTYLVGNRISAADVALYGSLHPAVSKLPSSTYYTLPSLTRWFNHVQHDPAVSSANHSLPAVQFDLDNAPKMERTAESSTKKDKKAKTGASETKKEEKEKSDKKAAGKEKAAPKGGSETKTPKGTKAPSAAAEDSTPIPSMIDLRVGHIVDVKKHPDADGLYVEQIDLGEPDGPRTVVSGLVNYIPIEQMRDRWLIAVCNLKPASMRGVKSFAMVLCATSKDGKEAGIEVVEVPEKSRIPGERVYFEGTVFEGKEPLAQLNPKKKIFETIQPGFLTLDTREAVWKDSTSGSVHKIRTKAGVCTVPTLVGASLS